MTAWITSLWRDAERLRRCLATINMALVVFWVFAVIYIIDHPADTGSDGFEFLAALPVTGIAMVFTLPAALLSIWTRTVRVGALIAATAVVLNLSFWGLFITSSGVGSQWKCVTFYEFCKTMS